MWAFPAHTLDKSIHYISIHITENFFEMQKVQSQIRGCMLQPMSLVCPVLHIEKLIGFCSFRLYHSLFACRSPGS